MPNALQEASEMSYETNIDEMVGLHLAEFQGEQNVVRALKAEIGSQLKRGKQVQLDGFGTFYLERMEAPVQPGMKTKIPVREVVHFKAHNAVWTQGGQPNAAYVLTNR
jgi:nucleoid DNA-binding protein